MLTQDEDAYVRDLLDELGDWPTYCAHMVPADPAGPSEPALGTPALAEASELHRRIEAGEWIVDLRNRTVFAAGHAPATLNFGLDGASAAHLGWLITCGTKVTLLGETVEAVTEAQRELFRIGIEGADAPRSVLSGSRRQVTASVESCPPLASQAHIPPATE